jgi:hypothetical protein
MGYSSILFTILGVDGEIRSDDSDGQRTNEAYYGCHADNLL